MIIIHFQVLYIQTEDTKPINKILIERHQQERTNLRTVLIKTTKIKDLSDSAELYYLIYQKHTL